MSSSPSRPETSRIRTHGTASPVALRIATPADAGALLAIYAPYVRETAITFEYDVPSAEEFAERIATTLERYPYLVAYEPADADAPAPEDTPADASKPAQGRDPASTEKRGRILGYAYAGPFHARAAYDWAVETSIYVAREARGRHVGTRLLDALEDALAAQGVTNAEACIAVPDQGGSVGFHERRGYRMVGHFEKCGFKQGRWWDMVWMEHLIAPHPEVPAPLVPFPKLDPATLARILA